MADQKKAIQVPLMDMGDKQIQITPAATPDPVTWNQFEYKQFGNAPKIQFSGLSLIIMCPVLICAHIRASSLAQIPIIQFSFVTTLFAFLINYTLIIRKHQLMPFLPQSIYDNKLKRMCIIGVIGIVISVIWGWNGSGGILFAMGWESLRGNRMGFYGFMFLVVIVGSLLMEENFAWKKLIQFIPGVLFGSINSTLFTLRQSSFYAIAHQFLLLCAIVIPMLFPAFHIIVPSIWQWLLMLICSITILFTTLCTIKLMQTERVSVVMGVMSGIMMIGTSMFNSTYDYIGAAIILVGVGWIIKKQYLDVSY